MPTRIKSPGRVADPVLVIGSIAYDNIITPHATGENILGGSASYASLAASYFAPPQLVGVVGHDFKNRDRKKLLRRGIDLSGLTTDETGKTFTWKGRYHENYNRRDTENLQLNVFEKFRPRLAPHHQTAPYVLLGNIRPDLQLEVLAQLSAPRFIVTDTIDIWIETQSEVLKQVIRRTDLLIINDTEAAKLTGQSNLPIAGKHLLALGCKAAIIKKGEHGALLFHPEGTFALPAYPVTELRDPTGAGDSFAGALLGHLASAGKTDFATLRQAMVYGTVVASLTVEAFSTDRLTDAGCREIRNRRKEILKMIKV
jgi:sugar/nucleoside kinase (ribokinase family)